MMLADPKSTKTIKKTHKTMMMPADVEFEWRKFWAEWTLTGAHPSRIGHTIMEMMIVTMIVMMVMVMVMMSVMMVTMMVMMSDIIFVIK